MRTMIAALAVLLACAPTFAQTAASPPVQAGDTWIYHHVFESKGSFKESHDSYTVTRVTPSTLYVEAHQVGSSQPPKDVFMGIDWRRLRDVNGVETVFNQPLDFPLDAGKHWTVHYREEHPNAVHAWEEFTDTYRVVGTETVEVPAGKFDAIKIEAEGRWVAETLPASVATATAQGGSGMAAAATQVKVAAARRIDGRLYKAYWYVPAVRRWVKSVEEDYSASGERHERSTVELESYQLK